MISIRPICESDFDAVVELNRSEEKQTSPMNTQRLQQLIGWSDYNRVALDGGQIVAFIITMREGTDYDSDNYRWFASRFAQFLYVDRIVVASSHSGRQIGSKLYEDLFGFAQQKGISEVTCEYNLIPPNPASRAFHQKFGFKEVGTQWLDNGKKQVSLQVAAR